MKKVCLFAWLVALLWSATAYADDLVAFDRARIADAQSAAHARVVAKIDKSALALIPSGNFGALRSVDNSAVIVQSNCDLGLFWLALAGKDPGIRPAYQTENYLLLKTDISEARRVMASGIKLVKCLDLNLPPDRPEAQFIVPRRSEMAADVDSLMALVSADSVRFYIQRLQDFQTRYTGTDSFWLSGAWIHQKLAGWGYDSLEYQQFSYGELTSENVIATKLGTVYPDILIVVGGHFDSVVYDGGDPNLFAPGADDNATGTALMMEIARVLADTPLKKTVRFVAFGAEEQGLYGSMHYVIRALQHGENIELMINADMIGNVADDYPNFNVNCNEEGEPYGQILSQLAADNTPLIPEINVGDHYGSDHFPFDQAGFRIVYSAEGDFSPNWHMQTDVIANVDVNYCADIVRSNLGMLYITSGMPSPIENLLALNAGDGHTAYLSWDASPDTGVIGYEVLSGPSETSLVVIDTSWTVYDTLRNLQDNTHYYFAVTGFTADGNRSLIDDIVGLTVVSRPTRPDTLIVYPLPGQISLEWPATPDLDFDHYQIWRRVGDSGDFSQLIQTSFNYYMDQNPQSNTRYYYFVTVVDTTDLAGEPSMTDYAKVISLDSGILLVDEMSDGGGDQGRPTDARQDSFYTYISQGYRVTFHDYRNEGTLRINDLGPYSTIAWMDDDASSHYLPEVDEHLAQYLDFGGNLLFVGWRALYAYYNVRPYTFPPDSFPNRYLYIETVNSDNDFDFTGADAATGWPDLTVVPERVMPGMQGRLLGVDVMTFSAPVTVLYTYNSFSGDTAFAGRPVGFAHDDNGYKRVYTTFPLYAMGDSPARQFFRAAMTYMQEPLPIEGDDNAILPGIALMQNYPNPFNSSTSISVVGADKAEIAIYDIAGRQVALLHARNGKAVWDARGLSSGLYFARLVGQSASSTIKLVYLK